MLSPEAVLGSELLSCGIEGILCGALCLRCVRGPEGKSAFLEPVELSAELLDTELVVLGVSGDTPRSAGVDGGGCGPCGVSGMGGIVGKRISEAGRGALPDNPEFSPTAPIDARLLPCRILLLRVERVDRVSMKGGGTGSV